MTGSNCNVSITYQVSSVAEDHERFQSACQWIAREFGLKQLEVSIAIVDDETIHALNRQYLDHDWPTDVISFVFSLDKTGIDGEIIASADTAIRLSQIAGWSPMDELLLYVVHGLLHLAGLDDFKPREQAVMRDAERRCLIDLGVAAAHSHIDRWDEIAWDRNE